MNGSLAITATSMQQGMERLNVISHNLANANTTAYKRDMALNAAFETQLSANLRGLAAGTGKMAAPAESPELQRVADMSSGSMRYTGESLHVAMEGKGFFQIIAGTDLLYSRDGSFQRDASGRLVNAHGLPIAGQSGEIRLADGEIFIDAQARLWENDRVVDQLRIVDFQQAEVLEKRGAGLYASNGAPPIPLPGDGVRVRQGYLETSNVAVMQEMIDLISVVRHFEMNQQLIKGYDEIMGQAIDTLGKF